MKKYRILIQIDEILNTDPDEFDPVEVVNRAVYVKSENDDFSNLLMDCIVEHVDAYADNVGGIEVVK